MRGDFNVINFSEGQFQDFPIINNVVDIFFQELEILLTTDQTDVFGNNEFGLNVQTYLWRLRVNEGKLIDVITAAVKKYCFSNEFFKWTVDVKFMGGSFRDIALITFNVYDQQNLISNKKSFLFR